MTDPIVPEQTTPAAPVPTEPALTAAQIAEIVAKTFDARIPGLMSVTDKKIDKLARTLDSVKSQTGAYEPPDDSDKDAELAAAKKEADFWRVASAYPTDRREAYQQILSASTADEQMKIIDQILARGTQQQAPAAPVEPPPSAAPVDLNNPRADASVDFLGDEKAADEYLKRVAASGSHPWYQR